MMMRIAALLLATLVLIPAALALGIAPARNNVDFIPGETATLNFRIYNSDRQNFRAEIRLNDELAKIAKVEPELIEFKEDDVLKPFTLFISFGDTPPENLEGKITITSAAAGNAPVSASIEISARLNIVVTGAVVAEPEEATEFAGWMKWALGLLFIVIVGGNIIYFLTGKKEIVVPHEQKPYVPPEELEGAEELEQEIERLRELG